MPRVPLSSFNLILDLRRGYTVAAENVKGRPVTSNIRKVAESSSSSSSSSSNNIEKSVGKDIFWMRDPKTGNWIPETHFSDIDAAEQREKFLSSNRKFTMPKA
uniref:Protein SENESCENCE-ASSOCIATED GENE 21, mitochondrial-like n=1 Tax=Nicotiana tabacum TaxID=4097 RepID=A0A1S3Y720_TOBAC|nr:PREDICTED: protein SENESCENCE-ASSOCIATED GENE 21, mitochondrial-like [Nicotiana tabacum]